jgi:hypothetical protein
MRSGPAANNLLRARTSGMRRYTVQGWIHLSARVGVQAVEVQLHALTAQARLRQWRGSASQATPQA